MNYTDFTEKLLRWYAVHRRDLPWRATRDPYIIWLSEIILQQTRVAQGLPYFRTFVEKFPTVSDLAAAPEQEILRTWQGLGYYSRARNLHACAREIVDHCGGNFPDSYRRLLQLRGVGPYTAAAIASFSFREPVAVVDGNVYRLLSRYFGIGTDIGSTPGKKEFERLANRIIPSDKPDLYNQAIMEFGALQCRPKSPDCDSCPLKINCFAWNNGMVSDLPVKEKKVKTRTRYFIYYHIRVGGFTVVHRRGANDIWQGLTDFPLEECHTMDDILSLQPESLTMMQELAPLGPVFGGTGGKPLKHLLTHQKIFASFVKISIAHHHKDALELWAKSKNYVLADEEEMEEMGKPKLILRYLNQMNN
ncbi:A/G-specific DNA-adenine glycosylase [Cyclobacterium lianum]|uniref:Adenine DNA glycosylase n=1 Tax=Cyclobacterium lianum TaxID=388280 RepID=A0A1M7PTS9_9BACT|nr:A/G-specific adenine glycosylase [Cyclobacterium lianum]SHN20744.1 A/G-specific DNA-adenine glycosylase [Cyclobacterium lianum]